MDDWSDSDVEGVRDATPKSNGRYSQDLFSERISQFSDFDDDFSHEAFTPATGDVSATKHNGMSVGFSGSEFTASGVNTSWLSSPTSSKSSHKTQRSSSRASKNTKHSKASGKQAKVVVERTESITWSQDFPDDPHDSLATLSPDQTQHPVSLPKFSFLKNDSVDSTLSSPPPSTSGNSKSKSATKRLGSRFSYPKGKAAASVTSSDSQLEVNLEVMKPPNAATVRASGRVKKEQSSTLRYSKSAGSESESQLSVVLDLLQPGDNSINDETILTTTSVNTATSDATAYQPSTQLTRQSHNDVAEIDSQSLGSMDISMKDRNIHNSDVMMPATYDDVSLELSPSFRALAEELDDPQVRPSETQIQKIEQELDQMADELPGMSGWSSLPDISSQSETVKDDNSHIADNDVEERAPVAESADIVYGTLEDSAMSSERSQSLRKSQQKKHRRKKSTTDDHGDSGKQKKSNYSVPDLSDEEIQPPKAIAEPEHTKHQSASKSFRKSTSFEQHDATEQRSRSPKTPKNSAAETESFKQRKATRSKSSERKSTITSPELSTARPVQFTSSLSRKAARPRASGSTVSSTSTGNTQSTCSSDLQSLDSNPRQVSNIKELSRNPSSLKKTLNKSKESTRVSPNIVARSQLTHMDASIDLTASDEDELAGVISRKDDEMCMADVDLTNSDSEDQVGSAAEDVPSGSEECPSIQSIQKVSSALSSKRQSLESVITKPSRRARIIELDTEDESENGTPSSSLDHSNANDSSAKSNVETGKKFTFKSKVNLNKSGEKGCGPESICAKKEQLSKSSMNTPRDCGDESNADQESSAGKKGGKRPMLSPQHSFTAHSRKRGKIASTKSTPRTPGNNGADLQDGAGLSKTDTPTSRRNSARNISAHESTSAPLISSRTKAKRSSRPPVEESLFEKSVSDAVGMTMDNSTATQNESISLSNQQSIAATTPVPSPRRSQRINNKNSAEINNSMLSDIFNTPNKQQELDMLIKTTLSPLKDLPTNLPLSTLLGKDSTKSKRKHSQFSHERLVIDVTLPPSQLNPTEQVQSLLEFLEDTAAALHPPEAPILLPESEKSATETYIFAKKSVKAKPTPVKKSKTTSSKKYKPLELSKSTGSSPSTRSSAAKQLQDFQAEDTMLDRSSFLELMGKSPRSRSRSKVQTETVTNKSLNPATPNTPEIKALANENTASHLADESPITSRPKRQSRSGRKRTATEESDSKGSEHKRKALQPLDGLGDEVPVKSKGKAAKPRGKSSKSKAAEKVVEETALSDADEHAHLNQSDSLDENHQSERKVKPQKKEPIWLAKYSVPRNRKQKSSDESEESPTAPTKAEAVCNLFAKSYSGRRYNREPFHTADMSNLSTAELASTASTSAQKDTSVFDFVPSQPSPVKTKKRGKTAKSTGVKSTKQTEAKKASKPRKNTKKALAHKQELIKQMNQDWGIEPAVGDGEIAGGPEDCLEPPLSQATALRKHIDDIDSSVTLMIEKEAPKKHCRFRTPSFKRSSKQTDPTETVADHNEKQSDEQLSEAVKSGDLTNSESSRSRIQQDVNQNTPGQSGEEVPGRKQCVDSSDSVLNRRGKRKADLLSDSNDENINNIRETHERVPLLSSAEIKREIGPDEFSPSTILVQPKKTRGAKSSCNEAVEVANDNPEDKDGRGEFKKDTLTVGSNSRSKSRSTKTKAGATNADDDTILTNKPTEISAKRNPVKSTENSRKSKRTAKEESAETSDVKNSTKPEIKTPVQSDIRLFVASNRSPASELTDQSLSPLVRRGRHKRVAIDDTDSQTSEVSSAANASHSALHATLSPIVKSRRRAKASAISSASETSTVCKASKSAQRKGSGAEKSLSKTCDDSATSPESTNKGPTIKEYGRPTRNTQIGAKLVFTHTSLTKEQKKSVEDCAKILDAEVVSNYTSKVTHVITSIDADLCCPRTLKYMLAVLEGKWVVSIEWCTFCLEASSRVPENIFEVRGSSIAPKSAASGRSREAFEDGIPRLLSGCEFFLSGDFKAPSPPKDQLCQLIQVGGAKVLNRLPREGSSVGAYHAPKESLLSKCGTVILSANRDTQKIASVTCASPAWLLDCIAQYTLTDPGES